jgi:glutamine synthetase
MHTNMSFQKNGKNLFWGPDGADGLSDAGWLSIGRILDHALDLCLVLNPSVNAYRRLDPHYEAPNQIKASANNRGAMVRIPTGNERSARIEVRSVAPDANPYLVFYTLARTALEPTTGTTPEAAKAGTRTLPDNIGDAIRHFSGSAYTRSLLGETVQGKYAELKQASADRCAHALGSIIKVPEIQFHHEVTNQFLWSRF